MTVMQRFLTVITPIPYTGMQPTALGMHPTNIFSITIRMEGKYGFGIIQFLTKWSL